jgi:hypothetical protein
LVKVNGNEPEIGGHEVEIAGHEVKVAGHEAEVTGNVVKVNGNEPEVAGNGAAAIRYIEGPPISRRGVLPYTPSGGQESKPSSPTLLSEPLIHQMNQITQMR